MLDAVLAMLLLFSDMLVYTSDALCALRCALVVFADAGCSARVDICSVYVRCIMCVAVCATRVYTRATPAGQAHQN